MPLFKVPSKTQQYPLFLIKLIKIFSLLITLYLLSFLATLINRKLLHSFSSSITHGHESSSSTSLEHIVFGIASNEPSWSKRKDYVKLWWRPHHMRGCVFLEKMPPNSNETDSQLPPICISQDTSHFRYTHHGGSPSAVRLARVVTETVAMNHSSVRWFVFGDDDTIFFPENLAKTLSKYDHELWYYVGTNSESFWQNKYFSREMAFGGGGFAISYPLARVLAKVFDSCLERYPHLYGSDGRVHACLAELGVAQTQEPGFHQMDIRGNMFGLLAAHPTRPVVSLHHLDTTDPIFPNMTSGEALAHLFKAWEVDPHRLFQQTVCYDQRFSWTISVSWGYAIQVFGNQLLLPDALRTQETYTSWQNRKTDAFYELDTREYRWEPCGNASIFFLDKLSSDRNGILSVYSKRTSENCTLDKVSPSKLVEIRVYSQKMYLDISQLKSPRRQCCNVLPSSMDNLMEISIRKCKEDELIRL